MRHACAFLFAMLLAGAQPVAHADPQAAAPVELYQDADTSEIVASTRGAASVKSSLGYSPGAMTSVVMWVEARLSETGAQRVVLAGEQLRYVLPKESGGARRYGPSDPEDPVFVGSPWKPVDLRYRDVEVVCWGDAYWCAQVWSIEIPLDEAVVDGFLSGSKARNLRVSLSRQKRVDWRVERADIIAVRDAIRSAADQLRDGGSSEEDAGAQQG